MAKILITYFSRSGNTASMAESIRAGTATVGGADITCAPVDQIKADQLLGYDCLVIGSPVYYGGMAAEVKSFIDESVRLHGQLEGKLGGAFVSGIKNGGGNETALLDILHALLVHGLIIAGSSSGSHYGLLSLGQPDEMAGAECQKYGQRLAALAVKLFG